ncbi:DUF2213 domain-containing protein [Escherichia coli O28ac]|uniref:Uncharacterized protein conserved in bacteria n=1 Tax=Escherichia coli TaxID=562 RepID=A0A377FJG2_ECOLX|nr:MULTISPECIES: DUF2213 domain-containing protein [Enterobacteriaceae]EFY9881530.1 DUF2213 domain-containing protein [Shigella dysenteriae]EGF7275602.1 DUF2213 domain-containing protein [Shigella flexneri]EHD3370112.1 DUF2213 domain-containing protein [Escherichia coli O28ac]EAA4820500.1 DUF2213 domain-containing protein [Escherichia coli]EEW2891182.1 DUF2213 domain-containing protein [Escherichia coli]
MIITEMLAFDRASVRQFDKVGRLQIERSNLSKANVCGYFGYEIPGAEALGLDPKKLYQLYRDPDELRKAVSTFNNIPVLCRHKPDYPGAPAREYRVGTTHANSEFDGTYLVNGMSIWDNSAIAGIETDEQREISSSYAYVADMTPGTTPDGEPYDGVMRNIVGNHVALVGDGRVGSDCLVMDSLPQELKRMKLSKKEVAVLTALGTYLAPRLAQDAAPGDLLRLMAQYKRPAAIASAVKTAYSERLAQDMDIEPAELAQLMESAEAVPELVGDDDTGLTDESKAFDTDSPMESVLALLSGKVPDDVLEKIKSALSPTTDEAPETKEADVKPDDVKVDKPAMDAAIRLATDQATKRAAENFRAVRVAEAEVRPLIGDVVAMDCAEDVYRTALEQTGIDIQGIHPSAYRSMVKFAVEQKQTAKSSPRVAMDQASASTFAADFPGAKLKRGY